MLSFFGHAVTRPFARLSYVVVLPSHSDWIADITEGPSCAKELNRSRGSAPRAGWWCHRGQRGKGAGASCLKIEGLATSLQIGVSHDRGMHHPTSPAHDREHERPPFRVEDPARLHPHGYETDKIPRPIAGHGDQ